MQSRTRHCAVDKSRISRVVFEYVYQHVYRNGGYQNINFSQIDGEIVRVLVRKHAKKATRNALKTFPGAFKNVEGFKMEKMLAFMLYVHHAVLFFCGLFFGIIHNL